MIRKINLLMIIAVWFTFILSSTIYADVNDSNNTITGDYQYSSSIGGVQLQNKFEYRDDCFTRSSYLGCKHLESLSIQVAASSISFYSEGKDTYEIDTEDNAHNVIDFLTKMKFEDVETNQYYKTEKRENSMGVCVGHKSIMQDGNSYTLLAIVPRSAGYKQEWAGNFTISDGDIHEGFKAARDEILRFVKQYINNNKIEGKIKVWISGYSRGAAISDMLGGFFAGGGIDYFEDVVSITPEDVYCYTIGTPRTIKDGLDKNIELSVSANRDEDEYKDDTNGEEFIYTKGGKVVVGDKIYGGLRNLISSSDSFPLLPPEEWGYTHYGNRIDPTEGLSSIEDALEELKSISDYVYDIYTENNDLKKLKLKTFDLKKLSIVEKGKKVNPADFMKEKVDGLANRIGSNKDFYDQHYQDGLKSFVGAYGLLAPILNDAISGDSISTGDAIKTLLYTYVAYASETLQEEGIVHDDKEAIAIIIKDLLEHFLEIDVDLETFTIDDLFANVTKYLADNMDEPVGKKAISGVISSLPEQYKSFVIQSFGRFHKDYYMNNDTYEVNPDVTDEDIIKEYIRACVYGADPECTIDDNFRKPKQARTAFYTIVVMATANDYPEIVSLLFDSNYQPDGHGLLTEAIDLFISNLLIDKDDKGEIVKEYENISQLADEGLLKLLEPVQRNAVDISKDIYGEEYSKALKHEIDGLKENITEARKAISTLLLYQSGGFDAVASLEGALSIIDDAMTVVMSHLDEVYLAYSRTSERYEEHFPVTSGEEEITPTNYTVSFNSNGGSSIDSQTIVSGEKAIKPTDPTNDNLHFIGWFENPTIDNLYYYETDDEGYVLLETLRYNTFDFETPITEDIELKALWVATYQVNTSGDGKGQIATVYSGELEYDDEERYTTSAGPVIIGLTDTIKIGAKEANGSKFVRWTVSGETYSTNREITVNITKDIEFIAEFELIKYKVTYDANGGAGTMSGETSKYYIFPESEYTAPSGKTFDKWEVDGTTYAVHDDITLTKDITVKAIWKNKSTSSGGGSSSSSFKITTKMENGTITPANTSVKKNADQEFTFQVNDGYEITDVLVDGKSVGVVKNYQLEKVTTKHTIEVKTEKVSAIQNVDEWAKEEMTKAEEKGLIPETFVKKDATKAITRKDFAAVAVKLYESISNSKAEPIVNNPFVDTDDEYVLKAYVLGITLGTSETTFTPNAEITREQMATMLTRALRISGINTKYDITNATRFADDSNLSDWGRPSVYFMAHAEIIKGIGDNRFNGLGNAKIEEALAIAYRCVEVFAK